MNQPQILTEAEEAAYEENIARNDLRRQADRAAGLYNDLLTGPGRWREFLEKSHAELFARWPEIHSAIVDARRWENPCTFNGSFAEKVARAKPLPAITTVGQMERLICRALVMMQLEPAERERLIKQAYAEEKEAQRLCEESRIRRLGIDDVDLSGIEI
jgi:hypothetical protein